MVMDPVCKMTLSPESAVSSTKHAGQTYYFCSQSCHARFLANPAGYVGKTLAQQPPTRLLITRAVIGGLLAAVALLILYFGVITLVSGWEFTLQQFQEFWPYVIALTIGFGIQVGLYLYLRRAAQEAHGSGKIVAVSGTTSGIAMVSCCAHYLVNLLPVLGATGLVALIGQYQLQLFWLGLAANFAGIAYIGRRMFQFARSGATP